MARQVAAWEAFLNGSSLKQRITARYLYEHWLFTHLYLDDHGEGPFFEVVRSRTPPGAPIDAIATVRPYDDPETDAFYYRLRPIRSALLHKTHIVYPLGKRRMRRLSQLFLESDWTPMRLPSYAVEEAANPFVSFDQIPARSRYQFLLDDARYFIMTFIRGPVCRGQVAVDVIEDHFWVAFLSPEVDLSVTQPAYLQRTRRLLDLPAEHESHLSLSQVWIEYNHHQSKYLAIRERFYDELDPGRLGPELDWIWDGEGSNPNALLSVFRNFDNATVVYGFAGEIPETAWIIDFPIFERIYYNLVAGFDVFGNVTHQVATRLYMDHLRMQAENTFLAFLPRDRREEIRASWYEGATRQLRYFLTDRTRTQTHGTRVAFTSDDLVGELLEQILARGKAVAGPPDRLNRCPAAPCDRPAATALERRVERELQSLASVRGPFVAPLPEVTLLRVEVDASGKRDLAYALVHNRAHANVAFMFGEDDRLQPEKDTLTLVPGHFGSYPNFLFEISPDQVADFVRDLGSVVDADSLERVATRYGVRRTGSGFWSSVDWLHDDLRRRHPTEAGLYDIGRYGNP